MSPVMSVFPEPCPVDPEGALDTDLAPRSDLDLSALPPPGIWAPFVGVKCTDLPEPPPAMDLPEPPPPAMDLPVSPPPAGTEAAALSLASSWAASRLPWDSALKCSLLASASAFALAAAFPCTLACSALLGVPAPWTSAPVPWTSAAVAAVPTAAAAAAFAFGGGGCAGAPLLEEAAFPMPLDSASLSLSLDSAT